MKIHVTILISCILVVLTGCSYSVDPTSSDLPIQEKSTPVSTPNRETEFTDPVIEQAIRDEGLSSDENPIKKDFATREYREQIHGEMPEYIFEVASYKDEGSHWYHATKIRIRNSEAIIQEILPSEYTYFETEPEYFDDGHGFVIEDMNFDGYADIRIVDFLPAGPNIPYVCWVWNSETEQYIYDSKLSDIPALEVDYDNELIYAFGRSSASEHFEVYYKYIDGVLTLIKEVTSGFLDENDPDQGYSITYELYDNQWIMTGKEKINIAG